VVIVMRVLLVGATGYVGSVVAERLAAHGHEVVALVRPGRARQTSSSVRHTRVGDLSDPGSLRAAVTSDVDAVVHAGTPSGVGPVDMAAVDALLEPLAGTDRAFVYLSGVWVLGATGDAVGDETSPTNPVDLVRDRPAIERRVLGAASAGVRSTVVRPGVVHGRGGGIPALLVELARAHGTGRYVGGQVRWPMVHVDDLADLVLGALERAEPGTVLHAVAEDAVPVADLARAASVAAGVTVGAEAWDLADAGTTLGSEFAEALALDQACSAERTRRRLGWAPSRVGAVEDLASGSYAPSAAA
jgi:nucleoside-diphosphate-sugar epimerase